MKFQFVFIASLLLLGNIELETRSLLNDKIEILVPKEFKEMSKELLDVKYPRTQNRPSYVLTDEGATVNVAFTHLPNAADKTVIEAYKNSIKSSYEKAFPTAVWKGDGVATINDKQVGYLKLITQAADQKVYNYLFMTDVDGKLLIGTFNCTEKLMPEWEEVGEKIVKSLKVKTK